MGALGCEHKNSGNAQFARLCFQQIYQMLTPPIAAIIWMGCHTGHLCHALATKGVQCRAGNNAPVSLEHAEIPYFLFQQLP